MPPGAVHRCASGFFQRLPDGSIAFLPSIFRLPWHAKQPRKVGPTEITRLLRAETREVLVGVAILIAAGHYFFFDILDFYIRALSNLPLAVTAHLLTMYLAVATIFRLNNIPFAWSRARMIDALPVAAKALTPDILDGWQDTQRLWRLSLMNGRTAANLNKHSVILYIVLFVCSLPLLVVVMSGMLISGAARDMDGTFGMIFAVYGVISVWAFLESSLVLRRRLEAGRRRRLARANQGGAQSDPA
jgi:hypothetical protein